ncbi:HNH endonuclease [Mycobacterium sp. KBS0706]|uniref:HNH endonuclease n=1 Tax=Mycobacterium sp. KBS0706 TaxID=2578109 RepID=UPI001C8F285F|nr:HNH endonuclease [Mycobacterium sp. KBS0706]
MPEVLKKNGEKWTQIVLDRIANNEKPTPSETGRYKHTEIKRALISETCGKCAYCESKLLHIHHGDVEHFVPKSLDPARTFDWNNLILACEICNQSKSDIDPHINFIINPYITDPGDHLIFSGPLIFSKGTPQGKSTIRILKLDRAQLYEARKDRAEKVTKIMENLFDSRLTSVERKAIYKDLIDVEASRSEQYSAMIREMIRSIEWRLPSDIRSDESTIVPLSPTQSAVLSGQEEISANVVEKPIAP